MEIKFQIRGRVFSIIIGRGTAWFGQISFITIAEEFYDENYQVVYATHIKSFG